LILFPRIVDGGHGSSLISRGYSHGMKPGLRALADRCVLLFSTDWFRPYWPLLGLYVITGEEQRLVEAMRGAVRELIAQQNDYFDVDFGDARIAGTKKRWLDALSTFTSSDIPPALLDVDGRSLDERRRVRDENIVRHQMLWDELMAAQPAAFVQTDWDRWIASATAAVPDYLRTFAWSLGWDPTDRA